MRVRSADAREGGLRRPAAGLELQAGVAAAGRMQRVLDNRDLLLLMEHGGARVRCRRRVDTLPPALLALSDPGEVLAIELSTASRFRALRVSPGLLAAAAGHRASAAIGREPRVVACLAAGDGLCEEADSVTGEADALRLAERVLSSRGCTVRVPAHERMPHAVVRRIRDQLRDQVGRRITLDELARQAGMCRFALVRAFTKEVGMPPHAYQTHLRVARARELISAGRRLTDVALEVGFTDQSHMNRHFKCVVGTTPGEFARLFAPHRARHSLQAGSI